LLVQKYNIDIAEANIRQARLWANPTLYFENNLYDPLDHSILNMGGEKPSKNNFNNQYLVQVNQLINIAGKRGKLIQVAQSNKRLNLIAFEDALRSLRFQLHVTYAEIAYLIKKIRLYQRQQKELTNLVELTKISYRVGNVSHYDVTRLQYLLQDLQTNLNRLQQQLQTNENDLKVLVNTNSPAFLQPIETPEVTIRPALTFGEVLDSALSNSPMARMAMEQVALNGANLRLQKARAIPELNLGFVYDRYGEAYSNYSGIGIGLNLPFYDRNQNPIKIARYTLESARAGTGYSKNVVTQDVVEALRKFSEAEILYDEIQQGYETSLQSINTEAIRNYENRTISLLDFLDKINTYISGQVNLIEVRKNLYESGEMLNFVCNSRILP
jgi:cobalt-zinc-cadmium efflux system outer membrane protein